MTRDDIREKVAGEAARRVKEVRHLAMVVSTLGDDLVRSFVMRACVVLFWAHLEGFVKNSTRAYLEFLENEKITPVQLSGFWLHKKPMDSQRLQDTVRLLNMGDILSTRMVSLQHTHKLRGRIAHGDDSRGIHQDIRIGEMKDTISLVIESFKDEILKFVDSD